MNVYKVHFSSGSATLAEVANHLNHNEIGFEEDNGSVKWLAIECSDEQTALDIANDVVALIWGHRNK